MTTLTRGKAEPNLFMEKIIDEFLIYKDDHNNNTRTSYSTDLILFTKYLKLKKINCFSMVEPRDIEDFYTSDFLNNYERVWKNKNGNVTKKRLGQRSSSSKNRIISTLSSFFKYLVFPFSICVSKYRFSASHNVCDFNSRICISFSYFGQTSSLQTLVYPGVCPIDISYSMDHFSYIFH